MLFLHRRTWHRLPLLCQVLKTSCLLYPVGQLWSTSWVENPIGVRQLVSAFQDERQLDSACAAKGVCSGLAEEK